MLAVGAGLAVVTPAAAADNGLRVQIVMFDGVEELDWAAPFEVFSGAALMGGLIDTVLVALDGPRKIVGSYGAEVTVANGWSPQSADVIVVPGGGYRRQDLPGVEAEITRGELPRALAAARRRGLTIASVCTGAMILSAAGITKNRPCTTHSGAQDDLAAQGGQVIDARVVDDGDLVTAGGITSGLELGMWLVRRELGADRAVHLEHMLEYQPRGTVWQR